MHKKCTISTPFFKKKILPVAHYNFLFSKGIIQYSWANKVFPLEKHYSLRYISSLNLLNATMLNYFLQKVLLNCVGKKHIDIKTSSFVLAIWGQQYKNRLLFACLVLLFQTDGLYACPTVDVCQQNQMIIRHDKPRTSVIWPTLL